MKNVRSLLAIYLLVGAGAISRADGLSTSFVDVAVVDVPLGAPRRVESPDHRGLVLRNLGDAPISVHIEALVPNGKQLRKPARAIPEAAWISIEPNEFELGPHEEKNCDVIIEVPKKWRYRHEWYQAMIYSRGAPLDSEGIRIGAGLVSRLRFKTGT